MIRCTTSGKAALALAFGLAFAGALPFPATLARAGATGTGLLLSGGAFEPYRFAHARLECESGVIGDISVTGTGWNGEKGLLYEGHSEAWTEAVDLVFYVDEGLRSVDIDAETGRGRQYLSIDLSAIAFEKAVPDEDELARRATLRDLPLPFSSPRQARSPEAFRLAASGLSDAASQIAAACFCLDPPARALAALALFIAAAAGLAAVRRRMRPRASLAATLGLAGLAMAAIVLLLPREPRITIADLPGPRDEASLPYSGNLALVQGSAGGASVMRYSTSNSGSLSFMAISTPGESGLPLSVMESRPGSFVFSSPPVVFIRGAAPELHFERWTTGWISWQGE